MNILKPLALASMLFAGSVMAAPNVLIGNDTINKGEAASIPMTFQGDGSVAGFDFQFTYDASRFTPTTNCASTVGNATVTCQAANGTVKVLVSPPFSFPVPVIPSGNRPLGSITFSSNPDTPFGTYDLLMVEENYFDVNADAVAGSGSGDGRITVADPVPLGDANGDGVVNQADVNAVIDQYFGVATAPGKPDCNADGEVNSGDTICITNIALGG